MVDTTWLETWAETLARGRQPLGPISSWRKQLTERDTDPVSTDVLFDCLIGYLDRRLDPKIGDKPRGQRKNP